MGEKEKCDKVPSERRNVPLRGKGFPGAREEQSERAARTTHQGT